MNISKKSYKALKLFYKKISLSNEEVKLIPHELFSVLENAEYITHDFLGYLDGCNAKYTNYHITDSGKAYVQNHSSLDWLKRNWIALLSLIFAFIAALPVIIKAIEHIL